MRQLAEIRKSWVKSQLILIITFSLTYSQNVSGQVNKAIGSWPPFTKWYQNPLGVSPLALHTSNGIIFPTVAAGALLLLTKKDTAQVKRLSVYDDIGYTKGYYGSFSRLYHNNLGINYRLRKFMSVGVEFTQVYVTDDINQVLGLGLRPFFRFYAINKESYKLYFSSGAGLVYFFDHYPKPSGFFGDNREGTRLNGCPKYGIGFDFKINSSLNVTMGLWHIHFSNGNNPSFERNPGHDSNGFSVGLTYKPNKSRIKR